MGTTMILGVHPGHEAGAALVHKGTQPEQRVIVGQLVELPRLVAESGVGAPTLIIVGEVVTLRDKLKWYAREDATN